MIKVLYDPKALPAIAMPATFFIDVDDTLITPVSALFHHDKTRGLIDDLKKEKPQGWETILRHWRFSRKVQLVHKDWPDCIRQLKRQHCVYGLTQLDPFLDQEIEVWRYQELASLQIHFSDHPGMQQADFTCHRGIFFAQQSKVPAVRALGVQSVVLIDDRLSHLQEMAAYCKQNNLFFQGFHFRGIDHLDVLPDFDVAEFQKNHLLRHHHWLEDDEAIKKINTS